MISPLEALNRLREGNEHFVTGLRSIDRLTSLTERGQFIGRQEPFAVVLGCSDSRVPIESVFDQGLGDLFVIRVAGNIVASSQVGSVEYAVEVFGTRLVVVLGHSGCGVISVTLDELQRPSEDQSPALQSIVNRVRPHVEGLMKTPAGEPREVDEALSRAAVRANVSASADLLRTGSEIIEKKIANGRLLVVGAEYSLETGAVDFFDGVP